MRDGRRVRDVIPASPKRDAGYVSALTLWRSPLKIKEKSKSFFLERKKQRTFVCCGTGNASLKDTIRKHAIIESLRSRLRHCAGVYDHELSRDGQIRIHS
jgi:hypothetical protein